MGRFVEGQRGQDHNYKNPLKSRWEDVSAADKRHIRRMIRRRNLMDNTTGVNSSPPDIIPIDSLLEPEEPLITTSDLKEKRLN